MEEKKNITFVGNVHGIPLGEVTETCVGIFNGTVDPDDAVDKKLYKSVYNVSNAMGDNPEDNFEAYTHFVRDYATILSCRKTTGKMAFIRLWEIIASPTVMDDWQEFHRYAPPGSALLDIETKWWNSVAPKGSIVFLNDVKNTVRGKNKNSLVSKVYKDMTKRDYELLFASAIDLSRIIVKEGL